MTKKRRKRRNNGFDNTLELSISITVFVFFIYYVYIKPHYNKMRMYFYIFIISLVILFLIYFIYKLYKKRKIKRGYPDFILNLHNKLSEFTPIRLHKEEKLYQMELAWYLKNNYPNVKIEESRDYSRPDVIIDDIAIEIKWPTTMSWLKTIPDKINAYLPKWDYLFIILFNVQLDNNIYQKKKKEILNNVLESKRNKVFFIEINKKN